MRGGCLADDLDQVHEDDLDLLFVERFPALANASSTAS